LSDNTLLIVPKDYTVVPPDLYRLIADLREQGLIAAAIEPKTANPGNHPRYVIGEAYPRLLSFMGCAPFFKTEPDSPDDWDFCHLEVRGPWPQPRLIGRLDEARPRCPHCNKLDRDWYQGLGGQAPPPPEAPWTCPHCDQQAPWGELDWRLRAGYCRLALVLHHVYEGEAVPSPNLLSTLTRHTDGPWTWFYA
jgi:hypothetical protein